MKYSRFFALFLSVLIFFAGVNAQTSGSLNLVVKDSNGELIPGASLLVTGKNGFVRNAATDAVGISRFEGLSEGEYRVRVEASGFPVELRNITVSKATEVEITLPLGTITENVTVTATRTQVTSGETAVPVTIVGHEEIERKGVNTIGDVFRTLPGTSTVNEGAFQVRPRIRGLDSNRVLVLVDGERIANAREERLVRPLTAGEGAHLRARGLWARRPRRKAALHSKEYARTRRPSPYPADAWPPATERLQRHSMGEHELRQARVRRRTTRASPRRRAPAPPARGGRADSHRAGRHRQPLLPLWPQRFARGGAVHGPLGAARLGA